MIMRITKIAAALLMSGTAGVGLACTLPPLVAIPAKDAVGDKGPQIQQETSQYFEAMKAFTACVQAELTAAGGDVGAVGRESRARATQQLGRRRSPSRAQGLQRQLR